MGPTPKEVQITLRIPGELAEQLDQQAELTRTNRSWVIRDALHKYFENQTRDDAHEDAIDKAHEEALGDDVRKDRRRDIAPGDETARSE